MQAVLALESGWRESRRVPGYSWAAARNTSGNSTKPDLSPYSSAVARLASVLASSPRTPIHRLAMPSLLSPALYPPHASSPEHILQFLHGLRALLSTYLGRFTVMLTLPLSLYPRSSGL